jgi:hypothetical protein
MPKRLFALVALLAAMSAGLLAVGSGPVARADDGGTGSTGATGPTGPAGPTCDLSSPICYVSPSGTSADACTSDDPCDLATAVGAAADSDTIEIGAGSYPNTPAISDGGKPLDFVGVGGQTSISGNVGGALLSLGTGSSVQNLAVTNNGGIALSLSGGASADRVLAAAPDQACQFSGATLTNSVCSSTANPSGGGGTNAPVIRTTGQNTLVNDDIWGITAVYGIEGDSGQDTVNNTIVSADNGAVGGLDIVSLPNGAPMTFNVSYSNYLTEAKLSGSPSTFNNSNNLTTTVPKLANPASGDFHELSGSPTIGAGDPSQPAGPSDLYGDARQTTTSYYFSYVPATAAGTQTQAQSLTTTDIGADEAQGAPSAFAVGATNITADSATLVGEIAPDDGHETQVTATLSGLTTGQTYYFEVIADSVPSQPPLASFIAGMANSSSSGGGNPNSLPGVTFVPPTGPNLSDLGGASITATTGHVKVKKILIPITCGSQTNCSGNIHFIAIVNKKVKVKGKKLSERKVVAVAAGTYSVAGGAAGTATLKLSPGAATLLAAHKGKLPGLLEITPTGALTTAEQHFTLTTKVKKAKKKAKAKPKPKPKKKK